MEVLISLPFTIKHIPGIDNHEADFLSQHFEGEMGLSENVNNLLKSKSGSKYSLNNTVNNITIDNPEPQVVCDLNNFPLAYSDIGESKNRIQNF